MEDKLSKSYIERIEIKGLWGRFDVDWSLHPDVNILVGENGTGKSTILKFIAEILGEKVDINDMDLATTKAGLSTALLKLSGNNYAWYPVLDIDGLYVVDIFLCEEEISLNNFQYYDWEYDYERAVKLKHNSVKINLKLLQTFENQLLSGDVINKIANSEVKTALDFELYNLEKGYWKYQIELFERIVDLGLNKDEVNKSHRLFFEKINDFFKPTGKTIAQRKLDKAIVFNQDGTELSLYQLSSGEKQLLIILMTVLLQDRQPIILLLDEPEISLHLRWQYKLIEAIRELNPNCQVVVVTHSPSLFSDGWNDRVFWIEDICKPKQKL